MTTRPGPEDLVGAAEIALLLGGLSRQRVQQLVRTAGFPEPVARLDMGKVWWRDDVERWAAENRPASRRPDPGDGPEAGAGRAPGPTGRAR